MKKIETRTGAILCSSMRPRSATTFWFNKFKLLALVLTTMLSVNQVWGGDWTKVSSVSEITSGGTFIIGYWDGDTDYPSYIMPMQNTGTATTGSTGYMYSGTTEGQCDDDYWLNMDDPDETAIYEVEISASSVVSGAVNIKCGSNYIGNENAKNCCKLYASPSATTAFTPTITDGYVTLKIAANATYHTLQYNTGSPRFAVYNGGQKNLVLYKKAASITYTDLSSGQKSGHFQPSFLALSQIVIWGFFAFFCKKVFHIRCTKGAWRITSFFPTFLLSLWHTFCHSPYLANS